MTEEHMDWNSLSQQSGGGGSAAAVSGGIESALTTLQPIRDLAKNWDIDIAACLEEYLVDLEFSQETREHIIGHSGPPVNFNFTQAAIVLQNSSGIYSRKVDYLHSYAYKMQEDLVSTSQNQIGTTKGGNRKNTIGIDAEIEEFLNFDPHQEFLPLNDVIPTCELNEYDDKINLQTTDNPLFDAANLPMSARRCSSILDSVARRRSSHRPSIGSTSLFMDQSFVTDGSGSLINFATQKALLGALDSTGTLRLQTGVCDIGDDGILRIPGSSSQKWFAEGHINDTTRDDGAIFDNAVDDDSNDDGGFVITDQEETNDTDAVTNQKNSKRVTFSDTTVPLAPSKSKNKHHGDPWALLDSDATDVRKPRPLRIGKTIVLPDTVDKLPSECVTGARTRYNSRIKQARVPRVKLLQASSTNSDETLFSAASLMGNKRALDKNPSLPLHGLAYGSEFSYIAKAFAKRQADKRRELRISIVREKRNVKSDLPTFMPEYEDDDYTGDMGGAFDVDDDNDFDIEVNTGNDGLFENAQVESNTGIASISEAYKNRDNENDIGETSDTRTFEDLCRAHIAAFARGAEKYAAETRLSARVGQWQGKLLPLLEEEDRRPVFDIHLYGSTVIEKMESQIEKMGQARDMLKPSKVVAFRDITRDCQPFDVCRMFLAALSLNNSGNIQFTDESTMNSLHVELVNSDVERPMESYLFQMAA